MRPTGTKQQLEIRRRVAMALLDVGWGVHQVARQVKASPGSVCRWRDTVVQQGEAGLTAKRHPGSKPKLTGARCHQLLDLLRQGPRAHGFSNELWTLRRIAAVIQHHFGLTYIPSGAASGVRSNLRAVHASAMSRPLPAGLLQRGPASKKARRERRTIVFLDQSGFMLQPTVRRTWAPQGHTPIHSNWGRHDRPSVTGAITVSPLQKRLGLYFSMASANITGDDVFAFVQQLHRHLKRPLLVI